MTITILGSGTSHGIPVVGCSCEVCLSQDYHNKRTRSSILVSEENTNVLIDTATEFRLQAVREKIDSINAIFYTHSHADHLHGLDDIRPLTYKNPIEIYASAEDCREIRNRFPYIFNETLQIGGGKPQVNLNKLSDKVATINECTIEPIPVKHGLLNILGFLINDRAAYITDCSYISEESIDKLKDIEVLILGALRYREHSTHFNIDQALNIIKKISPKRAYLTHLSHDVNHKQLCAELPGGIFPAFDGLKIIL